MNRATSRKKIVILCVFACVAFVAVFLKIPVANFFMRRADYYFNGGAYDINRAIWNYRWALTLNGKTPYARYRLADALMISGNFSEALKEIDREIQEKPDFGKAYYIRGLIYGFMKKSDDAIRDFKKIIELKQLSETAWAVYNDLAWVQFQKGDYAAVEKTAKEGIERYPDNPWLLNSLGLAELNLGKKKQARKTLEKALELAKKLTEEDVRRAYPGNDFAQAGDKRTSIITSIKFNLGLVK